MSDSDKTNFPIRLDKEIHKSLKLLAIEEGTSGQAIAEALIRRYVNEANTPKRETRTEGDSGGIVTPAKSGQTVDTSGLSPEEITKVETLIQLFREGDDELLIMPVLDHILGVARIRHERKAKEKANKGTQHQGRSGSGRRRTG